jgi:amino acid transporter
MVGVVVIVFVLAIVPNHHQSASFVFTKTLNSSGFSGTGFSSATFWFVFGIGLLMAQYTYTGYDASAHMSEETRKASRAAAWGVVMSVVMSVIFGFILLVAVTFAVPDVQGTLNAGAFDVTYIWQTSLGTRWAEFLLFIVCCAQFYCGTASVTAASRMMFAFSRDGAVPGGRTLFRKVSRTHRVPVNAVIAIAFLSWALMLPTLANGAIGYLVGTSIAVIGLYIAYAVPVYLRWRAGDSFQPGAWSLGKHYKWINPLAFCWVILIVILFLMPTVPTAIPWHSGFDWNVVNYAPITVGGVILLTGLWWFVSARKWFKGPVVEGTEEELARIEAGLEGGGTPAASPAGQA